MNHSLVHQTALGSAGRIGIPSFTIPECAQMSLVRSTIDPSKHDAKTNAKILEADHWQQLCQNKLDKLDGLVTWAKNAGIKISPTNTDAIIRQADGEVVEKWRLCVGRLWELLKANIPESYFGTIGFGPTIQSVADALRSSGVPVHQRDVAVTDWDDVTSDTIDEFFEQLPAAERLFTRKILDDADSIKDAITALRRQQELIAAVQAASDANLAAQASKSAAKAEAAATQAKSWNGDLRAAAVTQAREQYNIAQRGCALLLFATTATRIVAPDVIKKATDAVARAQAADTLARSNAQRVQLMIGGLTAAAFAASSYLLLRTAFVK